MKHNFCFIIPSYCNFDLHGLQLRRCVSSIRKWHDNPIFIIDDFSDLDLDNYISNFKNVSKIKSQVKSAGDMVTYFNFMEIEGFKNAVIIQDSMTLERELDSVTDINTVSSIWYFTNHRHHWHLIKEPDTEYNRSKGIKVHDDLVIHYIDKINFPENFKNWLKETYPNKNKWSGNIGCQSIIDRDFLFLMEEKTRIVSAMKQMNDNRLRRVAESLFPLACQYMIGDFFSEKSYDGIYYDGINQQSGNLKIKAKDLGLGNYEEIVHQVCKNKYFSKITFDRRPIKTD